MYYVNDIDAKILAADVENGIKCIVLIFLFKFFFHSNVAREKVIMKDKDKISKKIFTSN